MLNAISKFIKRLRQPRRFDAFQIEITSRCNAKCIMCPRTTLSGWKNGDMALDTFLSLAESFDMSNHVHLQGWGEPLMHPELDNMIKAVKDSGAKAGFTTNGQLLNKERSMAYMDLGLDIMAVSLAGADKTTHEAIRIGTDFEKIVDNIREIAELKLQYRSRLPLLIISFIMLRDNIRQFPAVIDLAADIGADRVVAINMDLITDSDIDNLKVFDIQPEEDYDEWIRLAKKRAVARNISLKVYPIKSEEQPVCEADPLNNIYISFDGCVSPCVYLGLPTRTISRFRDGVITEIDRLCYGDIKDMAISEIWDKKEYVDFRKAFRIRKSITTDLYKNISCDFEFMERANELELEYRQQLMLRKPPYACRGCYKLFGV